MQQPPSSNNPVFLLPITSHTVTQQWFNQNPVQENANSKTSNTKEWVGFAFNVKAEPFDY